MRKIILFTATTLMMASAFGAGEIYRWRSADGAWHYSDQPRAGAELVRAGQPAVRPANEGGPVQNAPAAPNAPPPGDNGEQVPPVTDNVADQVRAEVAAAKDEQCKKAEAAYSQAIQARRIYKTDAQGNRVYMSSEEIDAARLQARANRDLACGAGT